MHTDQVKLGRVLANLIVNAIKYTNQGFVRVEAGRDNSGVWVRVRDSGIGIASADGTIGVESSSTAGTVFILRLPGSCVLELREPERQSPSKVPSAPDAGVAVLPQTNGNTGVPVAASRPS